jgi:methyltransferase-like protein/2-polyprenyl-3-methyl-5-hydroxy-6-metoxy-1,4-benzoquinol methylase
VNLSTEQESIERSYDEFPYESYPYPQSHPRRLQTISTLFGLGPAPLDGCRVLEIGCAAGGNLIPVALDHPESTLLGIDLSARQVGVARARIDSLGLQNIEIRHQSIMEVDAREVGTFDYVICHGVFSWVPAQVRERILSLCREVLAEHGVAYVSYNTYPGWHLRDSVRHMMRYHTAQFADATTKVAQARALLAFLSESVPAGNDAFGQLLRREVEVLSATNDSYLFHEHLEAVNEPMYFHEFVQLANRQGLQYLGESEFSTMLAMGFPEQVQRTLQKVGTGIVQMEQYMDFVRNRQFRATLLCHAERGLVRNVDAARLTGLWFSCAAARAAGPEKPTSAGKMEFRTAAGAIFHAGSALTQAALIALSERWPADVGFDALCQAALEVLPEGERPVGEPKALLAADLLRAFALGLIEVAVTPVVLTTTVSERPRASVLARWQAAREPFATNQRHQRVALVAPLRHAMALFDGESDRAALACAMQRLLDDGTLVMRDGTEAIADPVRRSAHVPAFVDALAAQAARSGFLVA